MSRYTKWVIILRISKKNKQHNGQKKKYKTTKHTHKTKDRVTRIPLKTGGELRYSGRVSSRVNLTLAVFQLYHVVRPGMKS